MEDDGGGGDYFWIGEFVGEDTPTQLRLGLAAKLRNLPLIEEGARGVLAPKRRRMATLTVQRTLRPP